jgi:large subunit ribosomal protein L23
MFSGEIDMKSFVQAPLVTEKNTVLSEKGVYVFQVSLDSTKAQIKTEIEKGFSVKVKTVRTVVCRGDMKYSKFGLTPVKKWKKAFVQLAAGQKISLFEGA